MKKIFAMACLAISALGFSAQAVDTWDGNIDTDWVQDESGKYLIYTAEELAGLANIVYNKQGDYSGNTFILMDDLNLNGLEWKPIGRLAGQGATGTFATYAYFRGTFDGNGHTISNFKINNTDPKTYITAGLFGAIDGATIKNLNVTGCNINLSTNHYYNFGGSIVGLSLKGTIINCSATQNKVTITSNFNILGVKGSAYAGGICGACGDEPPMHAGGFKSTTNTEVSDCTVAGNTISASGKSNGSNGKTDITTGAEQTGNDVYASTDAMTSNIAAINDNTIKKNNFGVNNGETANYYLNPQTGVATDYNYYVFKGVDDSKAQTGSLRQNSTYTDGALMMPYNYNGYNYKLYPSGKVAITITLYLEGFKGNWSDAGYFIERIYNTENGADIQRNLIATYGNDGLDKDGNATYNANTDRFMRTEVYELIMPANVTSVAYSTYKIIPSSIEGTAQEAVQVYGTNGALVVKAAAATELVVVSIDGRVVYNDMVEGNARIELPAGIYIANNHKVVVR